MVRFSENLRGFRQAGGQEGWDGVEASGCLGGRWWRFVSHRANDHDL